MWFFRDGANLPAKARTEAKRREDKCAKLVKARAILAEQGVCFTRARSTRIFAEREQWLERAICDTFSDWAKGSNGMQVRWEVALFEADPQLAFLQVTGRVLAVICEDVDMMIYGATRCIFKLRYRQHDWDYAPAECDWCDTRTWVGKMQPCIAEGCPDGQCLLCGCAVDLDKREFIQACVVAGCDYWPKVVYIYGIKKACAALREHKV